MSEHELRIHGMTRLFEMASSDSISRDVNLSSDVNVLCMKWGSLYGPHYVNRLYASARRNLNRQFRFVCFTDDASGIYPEIECLALSDVQFSASEEDRRWLKLGVFKKDLADIEGTCLFLDLDVVITAPIDEMFDYAPGKFCISHDWWMPYKHLRAKLMNHPKIGNTSVFRFEAGTLDRVLTNFEENSEQLISQYRLEQEYVTHMVEDQIQWWPIEWVRSFRRHCRPAFPLNLLVKPSVPTGAKIIAFHGLPKLDDARSGYLTCYPHKICRPSPWIDAHWSEKLE